MHQHMPPGKTRPQHVAEATSSYCFTLPDSAGQMQESGGQTEVTSSCALIQGPSEWWAVNTPSRSWHAPPVFFAVVESSQSDALKPLFLGWPPPDLVFFMQCTIFPGCGRCFCEHVKAAWELGED